ncbi:MAG TPA: ATP-binding protein, partial [Longimicrobiales bacterium]|nr:ATP-binding protein [Longimicrobiales bacterium]
RDLGEILPQFSNLFVVDGEGRLLCSAMEPAAGPHPSASDRGYFETLRTTGRFTVSQPLMGRLSRQWVVVLAVPLPAPEGEFRGAVGLSLALNRFHEVLSRTSLPPDGVITLTSFEGSVLARTADWEDWVGRTLPSSGLAETQQARGRGLSETEGVDGIPRMWGYSALSDVGWMVYVGVPTSWVRGPALRAAAWEMGVGGLILTLVSLLAISLYRKVASSLASLTADVRDGASGTVRTIPEEGPDEIVEVIRQVNRTLQARQAAEDELLHAKERYRSIVENAAVGIFVAAPTGDVLEANPALLELLGLPADTPPDALRAPEFFRDPASWEELVKHLAGEAPGMGHDAVWSRRDGAEIRVRLTGASVEDSRGQWTLEVMVEDVTRRAALEERIRHSQKMEAIGRLAGGVAHDFNNLLTVINGQANLLVTDLPEGSEQRESARAIAESGERAASITRQLLSLSRSEHGRSATVDLDRLVGDLEDMLSRIVGDQVELVRRPAGGACPVEADPGQLEQIILNLAVNGRDAMPEGGRLTVAVEEGPARSGARKVDVYGRRSPGFPGGSVSLVIEDTGVGMDANTRAHLFEPFFTTKEEGTGLGLATVYGIVARLGGRIEVDSREGAGARFTVELPRARVEEISSPPGASGEEAAEGSETILVVEDEPSVRKIVHQALTRSGYTVVEAESGEEALEVSDRHPGRIDLLLTDVVMPSMRGDELARRLREDRPEIKVFFISG